MSLLWCCIHRRGGRVLHRQRVIHRHKGQAQEGHFCRAVHLCRAVKDSQTRENKRKEKKDEKCCLTSYFWCSAIYVFSSCVAAIQKQWSDVVHRKMSKGPLPALYPPCHTMNINVKSVNGSREESQLSSNLIIIQSFPHHEDALLALWALLHASSRLYKRVSVGSSVCL